MDYIPVNSYEDPDTGELVEEFRHPETDEIVEYRNVRVVGRSSSGERSGSVKKRSGGGRTTTAVSRRGGEFADYYSRRHAAAQTSAVTTTSDTVTIKKSALGELIPIAGKLWASMLGRPDIPTYTGDQRSDYTNAALHRDALAEHEQNQLRITSYSDVAGRVLKLLMG